MIGLFTEDIETGAMMFREWTEESKMRCFSDTLEYDRIVGRGWNKEWVPVTEVRADCRYDQKDWPKPEYSLTSKKCRNIRHTRVPFKKEDYAVYGDGYDSEREWTFSAMALSKKLHENIR